ncbi:MAG: hypothetical protein E7033_04980 [Akkermansiaceae bacterium]|nr:hypothetical protein [Akkermansiaceae bacterium]
MHTLGIDFGTTKTLVSRMDEASGRPVTVRLGMGSDYIPTTVYIEENGQLHFGEDADDCLADNSGTYIRGFKMRLGSGMPLHIHFDDDGNITKFTAQDLVSQYLRYIRERVEKHVFMESGSARKAVITRPVNFSPVQLEELKQAAHAAGFSEVSLTTEPEAAGLAFCRLNASKAFHRSALIVDWGGGTLDFALVTRDDNTIHTHPRLTDGDTTMGGERFDEVLWNFTEQQLRQQGYTQINPITALPAIRRAKERLSIQNEVSIRLTNANGACPPVQITRDTFNALILDCIDQAAQKVRQLIAAIPTANKPEMLLLVGGSCMIPLIKERMEAACGLPAYAWNLSREAVGLGAVLSISPALATPQPAAPKPAPAPSPDKTAAAPQQQTEQKTRSAPPPQNKKSPQLPKKRVTSKIADEDPQAAAALKEKLAKPPYARFQQQDTAATAPTQQKKNNAQTKQNKVAKKQKSGCFIWLIALAIAYAAINYSIRPASLWAGLGIGIGGLFLTIWVQKDENSAYIINVLYSFIFGYIWAARYGGTEHNWSSWYGMCGCIAGGFVLPIIGALFISGKKFKI